MIQQRFKLSFKVEGKLSDSKFKNLTINLKSDGILYSEVIFNERNER